MAKEKTKTETPQGESNPQNGIVHNGAWWRSQEEIDANKDLPFEEVEIVRNPISRQHDRMVYTFDKLRVTRPRVRINMDQALELNNLRLTFDDNSRMKIFLLPGQPLPYVQRVKLDAVTYGEAEVVYPE